MTASGTDTPGSVAIVGASLAGLRCAESLRRRGFAGRITLVNAEPHRPYDRPPLSKEVLRGDWDTDRVWLSDPDEIGALELTWLDATAAIGLDVPTTTVRTGEGSVAADAVVIATGARPRLLPGAEGTAGMHVLRTLDDAVALRDRLGGTTLHVVVVGAGFIGSEVASSAASLGHRVTVVEADTVPLRRAVGDWVGTICGQLHGEHGVELVLGTAVTAVVAEGGKVSAIELSDGRTIDADVVVVGIGVVADTDWLVTSGLDLTDGVVCDEHCLAAPGVWAAGDVARWTNPRFGESMRVEHWDNAVEQGTYVAGRITGEVDGPYAPIPWFWSDQYGVKLQLAGHPRPDDEVHLVTGAVEDRRFAVVYGRGERLTGVFGMNRPRHVMQYRRLMADGGGLVDALALAEEAASR